MNLIERLAKLEHDQWVEWAGTIIDREQLSPERVERWKSYMVPYEMLDEVVKEHNRVWARQVAKILHTELRQLRDRYRMEAREARMLGRQTNDVAMRSRGMTLFEVEEDLNRLLEQLE